MDKKSSINQNQVLKVSETFLPTKFGNFQINAYWSSLDKQHHLTLVAGDVYQKKNVLVRIHSSCVTGDIFASYRCDCGEQLEKSMKIISKTNGVIIYLSQEGRGIGLVSKIQAMNLQEMGIDTVEANLALGQPVDNRNYESAAEILKDLKIKSIRLLTNNPIKIKELKNLGVKVISQEPLHTRINNYNKRYLLTKKDKFGHLFKI